MSSSLDHKCQRCGSQYHGQICPFCTITGLDVNALLASEGISLPAEPQPAAEEPGLVTLVDVVSNRTFPVKSPVCRLGRDISNDIVLTGDKSLSRFHFQITHTDDEYFVEDAGSRNGTFLNGSPVTAPRKILNGDIISAGMSRYRFVIGNEGGMSGKVASGNGDHVGSNEDSSKANEAVSKPADPVDKLFEEGKSLLDQAPADDEEPNTGDGEHRFQSPEAASPAAKQHAEPAPAPVVASQPAAEPAAVAAPAATPVTWPQWCTSFSFREIDSMRERSQVLKEEIAAKQQELFELTEHLSQVESQKNRLLATRDGAMVEACADVFRLLGWDADLNAGTTNELVLSSKGTAIAIAKIVCTEGQPKPNELANLLSSLSTFWCDHGVEPKGILLVAFLQEGKPSKRPELTKEYAEYAQKKNVCLMSSLQLLEIYRRIALAEGDKEEVKSAVLAGSGLLAGFELPDYTR